jgi:ferredoxin-NADP reductase
LTAPSPTVSLPAELTVRSIESRAQDVLEFVLGPAEPGPTLPEWSPGAHVTVHLQPGLSRSYSLVGDVGGSAYRIAVGLDRDSRGGSRFLHEQVKVGDRLRVDPPSNSFLLVDSAPCIFLAGGIGITPFVSMIDTMNREKRVWRAFVSARTAARAAYLGALKAWAQASGAQVETWFDDQRGGRMPDLAALIAQVPEDWHLYCCGPAPMIDAFLSAARERPSSHVHIEYFRAEGPSGSDRSFTVELARSGRSVEVPAGSSILDALMMAGIDAPYSCYEGLCGTCETRVLEGVPEHRDQLLTERARASNQTVIICRSGSLTPRLVLDL